MTTTEVIDGATRVSLTKDGPAETPPTTRAGWGAVARWVVSVGPRFAFLLWLSDATDGAALSPFAFVQDVPGVTVWQPLLVVLGLTGLVARAGGSLDLKRASCWIVTTCRPFSSTTSDRRT